MDHVKALLAGVLANPDDDAPRLVLADALEEADEVDRARFIRLQIEEARGDERAGVEAAVLFTAYREAWTGSLPWPCGRDQPVFQSDPDGVFYESPIVHVRFRRGFPENLKMSLLKWVRTPIEVFAGHPWREVDLAVNELWESRFEPSCDWTNDPNRFTAPCKREDPWWVWLARHRPTLRLRRLRVGIERGVLERPSQREWESLSSRLRSHGVDAMMTSLPDDHIGRTE